MGRCVAVVGYLLWAVPAWLAATVGGCSGISGRDAQQLTRQQVEGPAKARVASAAAAKELATEKRFAVKVVKDVAYYDGPDADAQRHKLDLYLPEGAAEFPVLVFIHGGGWTMGSKDQRVPFLGAYENLGRAFAERGIGTVLSNYRLSPKHKHPAHIEDVARAWAWVHRNIARYGGRPEQMFVMGQSAGGHLVALLACEPKYLQAHGLSVQTIRGVIAMSGVYDLNLAPREGRDARPPGMITQAFGNDPAVWREASPLYGVRPGLPPFLVISAAKEWAILRQQSERLVVALRNAGVPTDFLILPDKTHFSEVGDIGRKGDVATEEIANFIRVHAR